MQLPRIPSYEEASMAAGEYPTSPMSPFGHLSKKIDQTKLKTKVCRYYLIGAACPFGESCAFSHSEAAMASPPTPAFPTASSAKGTASISSEDLSKSGSANASDTQSNGDAAEVPERVVFGQPPPAYAEAMKEAEGLAAAEVVAAPPTYPKRFRFDPYSANWITYEKSA
ncbi:hypothetical protein ABB37_02943 [Leptomonas pyrrhocoris]|uniref:C3H1-type domain-containing protein n=1 Tax=Leptomonas pyrrhocoris TaxID=157538 RepID=A0A0M9G6A9_LEPPY|nr:hypothetical protein ABB37_02943 [Leptomonas pyrrhocoris]XP_015661706.1 hypothetical protein ABB37_02943 [Leptomonas pyrrhocoris]XP_015661707.1 hypothetical protein ABB37_02943 [Leptomonas pyrrhocoris]XP_015661708.1 hypothetical protein ABB37_02943 [Leptomonas pyrrhocoris]KPA83266.1 hypothetical protein ABB37_02943 [Leptomonas pyrrhocoris]KPA83267.1 hypothetical protein ABB37_02943 [Leptomonas pyrrhocoris]KPA83268.1 hypothetical protein ABB37_02943 [Leptomonas pyrrhocoris]KPA83269.1 hypot|eukprot:XP_015661705.1 hypothetical protein ABB37_02943 [Leptomonas pyrrhocoris]